VLESGLGGRRRQGRRGEQRDRRLQDKVAEHFRSYLNSIRVNASIVSPCKWVGAHPRISVHRHERYRHSARVRQRCDGANSVIDSESFRRLKNGLTSRKVYPSHGELEFIRASRLAAKSALRIFCIA